MVQKAVDTLWALAVDGTESYDSMTVLVGRGTRIEYLRVLSPGSGVPEAERGEYSKAWWVRLM
jgi:hypothetical protein